MAAMMQMQQPEYAHPQEQQEEEMQVSPVHYYARVFNVFSKIAHSVCRASFLNFFSV